MKQILTGYTYNPGTKQVTITDLVAVAPERLLAIIHEPTGLVLYSKANPALVPASVSTNVVTLNTRFTTLTSF